MIGYEIMLMLDPELPDDRQEEIVTRVREGIEGSGGSWGASCAKAGAPETRGSDARTSALAPPIRMRVQVVISGRSSTPRSVRITRNRQTRFTGIGGVSGD